MFFPVHFIHNFMTFAKWTHLRDLHSALFDIVSLLYHISKRIVLFFTKMLLSFIPFHIVNIINNTYTILRIYIRIFELQFIIISTICFDLYAICELVHIFWCYSYIYYSHCRSDLICTRIKRNHFCSILHQTYFINKQYFLL